MKSTKYQIYLETRYPDFIDEGVKTSRRLGERSLRSAQKIIAAVKREMNVGYI